MRYQKLRGKDKKVYIWRCRLARARAALLRKNPHMLSYEAERLARQKVGPCPR